MRYMEAVAGIAGCRSKSDASVTVGYRKAAKVVISNVVMLVRRARPEGSSDTQMYCPSTTTSDTC